MARRSLAIPGGRLDRCVQPRFGKKRVDVAFPGCVEDSANAIPLMAVGVLVDHRYALGDVGVLPV